MRRICAAWAQGIHAAFRCRSGRLAEDLRIGAAQIVAVEQRQIHKLPSRHPRRAKAESVGGGGRFRADQLRGRPRRPSSNGSSLVAEGNPRRRQRWLQAHRLQPAAPAACPSPRTSRRINLVAMRIQSRRCHARLRGQHLQPRNRDHRNPRRLGQSLHGGQPHAHPGKAPRPVHGHDRAHSRSATPFCASNSPTAATSVEE